MADLEKTIKRFELFADDAKHRGIVEVPGDLILDAIELLKERVKTPVSFKQNNNGHFDPECGHCGQHSELTRTYTELALV